MAYEFHKPAYYGDDRVVCPIDKTNWIDPSSECNRSSGSGSGSGDITELDFSKIAVTNAPWVQQDVLKRIMQGLDSTPESLRETAALLSEVISGLIEAAG